MGYETIGWPKRVLLVEDDPATGEIVKNHLVRNNYDVTVAQTIREAELYLARSGFPHIMLIEGRVSAVESIAFCERLRQEVYLFPIIIMSGDDRPAAVARGLETADDYVLKPITEEVLLLRIRNILRRIHDFSYAGHPPIPLNDRVTIDPVKRCIIVDDKPVPLTPIEFGLLMTLLKHRKQVVDVSTLIANTWRFADDIYEDTLRVHIHRLRRKIEADPKNPQIIVTERGVGYSLRI
jgi:DNA-binding response OmpR family regulator